jgi:hypothetical protein
MMRPADVPSPDLLLDVFISLEVQTSKVFLQFGVLLLHDNARPHIASTTVNLFNTWYWEILSHSPYSSDLEPLGLHLFPK